MKKKFNGDKMTKEQKSKFKEITGYEFTGEEEGRFTTEYPYNDKQYELSPYGVYYRYLKEEGLLCIEMTHRMTNSDVHVINNKGEEEGESKYIKYGGFMGTDAELYFEDRDSLKDRIK